MVFGCRIYFFVARFANRRAQKHVANPLGITNKGREMSSMARTFVELFFVHGRWSIVHSKFLRANRLWTMDYGLSTKIVALFILLSTLATAQPYQKDIKNGNAAFEKKAFDEAEVNYKKATEKSPEAFEGWFNLGNALYKQKRFDEALEAYQKGAQFAGNKERAAAAMHNIGNTFSAQKQYDKAVEAYKAALRLNPNDEQTRYNLAKALRELKQQQQQNKEKNDQKKDNKKDDKNQEKDKENPEKKDDPKTDKNDPQKEKEGDNAKKKQDQPKDENQQNKEKKQGGGEQKEKGEQHPDGQPQQQRMSKEEMDRLLQTIANAEKQTRAKIDKKKKVKVKTTPGVKDW